MLKSALGFRTGKRLGGEPSATPCHVAASSVCRVPRGSLWLLVPVTQWSAS